MKPVSITMRLKVDTINMLRGLDNLTERNLCTVKPLINTTPISAIHPKYIILLGPFSAFRSLVLIDLLYFLM